MTYPLNLLSTWYLIEVTQSSVGVRESSWWFTANTVFTGVCRYMGFIFTTTTERLYLSFTTAATLTWNKVRTGVTGDFSEGSVPVQQHSVSSELALLDPLDLNLHSCHQEHLSLPGVWCECDGCEKSSVLRKLLPNILSHSYSYIYITVNKNKNLFINLFRKGLDECSYRS